MISNFVIVLYDGLAFGMLLFVLSVGLSVTLGLMHFINLAHGAFGMLGGYITVTVMRHFGVPFLLALPVAFIGAALVSVVFERTLFRRLYGAGELNQVLFTIGLVFVATAVATFIFSTAQQPIQLPQWLRGSVEIGGIRFGVYRGFLIAISLVITAVVFFGLERTRLGARIRASVDNQRVAQGLGLDVERIFAITFALGSGLAGLGGALAIEIVGLDPTFAFHFLVYVLIVVSVGGLGSVTGSFAGAALLGIGDVAGKYFVPEIGSFLIYLLLVGVLLVRPRGLFGKR